MPKLNKETGEVTNPTVTELPKGTVFWKTPYNHDTNAESDAHALLCTDHSLTKQEFKEEVDINTIITRFLKTGEPPPMPVDSDFIDLTGRRTYEQMQEQLAEANSRFYELPAKTRAEFNNNPAAWADQVIRSLEDGDQKRLAEIGVTAEIHNPTETARLAAARAAETPTPTGGTPTPVPASGPPGGPKTA